MDADDWIEKNLLDCAVYRMQEINADIVQFGFVYEQDGKESAVYCHKEKDFITREEIKNGFSTFWKENRLSLWMQFFKKETVKSIRFENIIIGEDICYTMDAFGNAEKVAYISKALYHYRYIEGSTSHRWIENTIECREIIWNHQKSFIKSFGDDTDISVYAETAYDNYIWAIYLLSLNVCPLSYKEKKQQLSRLSEKMKFDKYRKYCPLKQQHGINRLKYIMVKYHLERMLLFVGASFLHVVRGE